MLFKLFRDKTHLKLKEKKIVITKFEKKKFNFSLNKSRSNCSNYSYRIFQG